MPLNTANMITASRLALVPVLLILAWFGHETAFLTCLIISLLTDILDGKIARWLKQTSELGARLDSWADCATYLSLSPCAYWLRPDLVVTEWGAYVIAVVSFIVPITIGFAKFRRLTSYHTRAATVAAYFIGASTIILFAHGPSLPFRLATGVLVLAEIEEIAITLVLPRLRSNVRSLKHALVLRHSLLADARSDQPAPA